MTNAQFSQLDQYDYFNAGNLISTKNKYSKPLGTFIIEFSELEHLINLSIAEILGGGRGHQPGYTVIEGLHMKEKLALYKRLFRLNMSQLPKYRRTFTKIINSLEDLNTFRNSLVHANWLSMDGTGYVRTRIRTSEDGMIEFKNIEITTFLIKQKRQQLKRAMQEMVLIESKLMNL